MTDGVDRRSFLRVGVLAAGAVAAGAALQRLASPTSQAPTAGPIEAPREGAGTSRYGVAIVGGGVSGIYAGYRLRGCDGSPPPAGALEHPRVALYEKSIHVLGRIRSVRLEGAERPGELGAMRFIPQLHPLVRTLVDHTLGLQTREFEVGGPRNIFYARNQRMTNRDIETGAVTAPYRLWPSEKGKTPDQLAAAAIAMLLPSAANFSEADWNKLRGGGAVTVRDQRTLEMTTVPLHEVGFQNALASVMSREAFRLVTDAWGYDSGMVNYHAVHALKDNVEESGNDIVYRTPVDGMSAIPNALRSEFEASGGEIHLRHVLKTVTYDSAEKCFVLLFDDSGETRTVRADSVILAMPPASLKPLVSRSPLFDAPRMAHLLDSVAPVPMTRVLSSFETAWWTGLGIESGRSVSDLPLRQLYYFGNASTHRPFVMAYTDGAGDNYFAGYQHPEEVDAPKHLDPSAALVRELGVQMSEIHGRSVPQPVQSIAKRWASDTYGGAYHLWNPGVRTLEVAREILQPVTLGGGHEPLPLYITGEAFSPAQGWTEGALATAEQVLAKLGKTPLGASDGARKGAPAPDLHCLDCHSRKPG